jgi:hypothetical protein
VTNVVRYWISLLASVVLFGAMNLYGLWWETARCWDCARSYGFPLPFFFRGGLVFWPRHFRWISLIVDVLFLLGFAAGVFRIWKWLSVGKSSMVRHK